MVVEAARFFVSLAINPREVLDPREVFGIADVVDTGIPK
jgi:hypothetical protein